MLSGLKPIGDFVRGVHRRYKKAYEKGNNRPAAQRAREQFKHGAKDGMY